MNKREHFREEIEVADLVGFTRTFIPRFDRYSVQRPDGSYVAKHRVLTLEMVAAHLHGELTLGAYALNEAHQAKWLCLDADDETEWRGLKQLADQLHKDGLPIYIETSRRGGHIWLFFDPIAGADIRRFGKHLLSTARLETIELYPRQDRLTTGPGSLVRLPLGIHRKSGKRYHFVKLDGTPLAPSVREQIHLLAQPTKVSHSYIKGIISTLPEPKPVFPTPSFANQPTSGETPSERIKNRISVKDFVSQYVDLNRRGVGLCPFHDDHQFSFGVNEQGNFWHCYACQFGGSVIDFWMKWRALHGQDDNFTATITELAQMLL